MSTSMPILDSTQSLEIEHNELRALAKRIALEFRLSAEKAVAHAVEGDAFPLPDGVDTTEHLFLKRYNSLSALQKETTKAKVMASVNASPKVRSALFDDLAAVRLDRKESVRSQVSALPLPAGLKMAAENLLQAINGSASSPVSADVNAAVAVAQTPHKRLILRIHSVRCDDETGGGGIFGSENFGEDEISLAGTAVNSASGITKAIRSLSVGSFDDGDVKTFNPWNPFVIFDATKGTSFPKSYFVTLVLAEVDMGGLPAFVQALSEKIEEAVKDAIAKAAGKIGTIGGAVAVALVWILGKVFDYLRAAWNDDVFPPATVSTTITAPTSGADVQGPEQIAVFKGHGGQYTVRYAWALTA